MTLTFVIFFCVLITAMIIFNFIAEYYYERCDWQVERIRLRAGITGTIKHSYETDNVKLLYIVRKDSKLTKGDTNREDRYYINIHSLDMYILHSPLDKGAKDLRLLDDTDVIHFKTVFHMYKYLKNINFKDYIFITGGYFVPLGRMKNENSN